MPMEFIARRHRIKLHGVARITKQVSRLLR